jgi:hypothetical protein
MQEAQEFGPLSCALIFYSCTIADAVYRLHEKRVVMLNSTARNILADKDLSLKLCGFNFWKCASSSRACRYLKGSKRWLLICSARHIKYWLDLVFSRYRSHSCLTREYLETDREAGVRIEEYEQDTFNGVESIEG